MLLGLMVFFSYISVLLIQSSQTKQPSAGHQIRGSDGSSSCLLFIVLDCLKSM